MFFKNNNINELIFKIDIIYKEGNYAFNCKNNVIAWLDGFLVEVQVDISSGLPYWEIVGLPDISLKESKERVRIAIKNSEEEFPSRRIVVNLAPANTKKEGSFFDLPIAIGILLSTQRIQNEELDDYILIGELSLDGKIKKVNGFCQCA